MNCLLFTCCPLSKHKIPVCHTKIVIKGFVTFSPITKQQEPLVVDISRHWWVTNRIILDRPMCPFKANDTTSVGLGSIEKIDLLSVLTMNIA